MRSALVTLLVLPILWVGSTSAQQDLFGAEVDDDEVAFEVIAKGKDLPPARVTLAEWEKYTGGLRALRPIRDEGMFLSMVLQKLVGQKATLLFHYDDLPAVHSRVREVMSRIESGDEFGDVARKYNDDPSLRQLRGAFGEFARGGLGYPGDPEVFDLEVGEIGGPYYTQFGVYIFRVDGKRAAIDGVLTRVKLSTVFLKYQAARGEGLGQDKRTAWMQGIRYRTDRPEFRRILPPAAQLPPLAQFGPVDVAPPGEPEKLLLRHSDVEALNQQPPPAESLVPVFPGANRKRER